MHHANEGVFNPAPLNTVRVDYTGKNISPYDDLTFDMYQV